MTERYGQPWTHVHGTSPSRIGAGEWGDVVSSLDEDALRRGFAADLERASDFPPSSAKFAVMCRATPSTPERKPYVSRGVKQIENPAARERVSKLLADTARKLGVTS